MKFLLKVILVNSLILLLPLSLFSNEWKGKRISLQVKNEALESVLYKIDDISGYSFSYSPDYLPVDSLVTFNLQNVELEQVLHEIFKDKMSYKLVAKTIIIRPNTQFKIIEKEENKQIVKVKKLKTVKPSKIFFRGSIISKYSKRSLSSVSILDPQQKRIYHSDSLGNFEFELKTKLPYLELYVSKNGYEEKVLVLKNETQNKLIIELEKIKEEVFIETKTDSIDYKPSIDSLNLVKIFVEEQRSETAKNLDPFFGQTGIQLSFTPGLSTNKKLNAITNNRLSINALGGYSKGVEGIEVGGLFNINRHNMNGLQVAGLSNIVAEKVNGIQVAGISNYNRYLLNGIQTSGILGISYGLVNGLQLSGFISNARKVNGIQTAGFTAVSFKKVNGIQASTFYNYSHRLNGIQASAFVNMSGKYLNGIQTSTFANVATGQVNGLQASVFFNYAKKINGLQIGLINVAIENKGLALGLFSFIIDGYHELDFFTTRLYAYNMSFKTGQKYFYNIFQASTILKQNDSRSGTYSLGYGIGSSVGSGDRKFVVDIDLTLNTIWDENFSQFNEMLWGRLDIIPSIKISGPLYIYTGPTIDLLMFTQDYKEMASEIRTSKFSFDYQQYSGFVWMGYKIGARI